MISPLKIALRYAIKQASGVVKHPYAVVTDRKGTVIHPGDYVSFATYPRGTATGWVQISSRSTSVWKSDNGETEHQGPALVAVTEDGTSYGLWGGKGLLKLNVQVHMPAGLKPRTASGSKEPWQQTFTEFFATGLKRTEWKPVRTFEEFLRDRHIDLRQIATETEGADYMGAMLFPQRQSGHDRGRVKSLERKVKNRQELERQYKGEVERTKHERALEKGSEADMAEARVQHKRAIRKALGEGKIVPQKVLAEYPEFQKMRMAYKDKIPGGLADRKYPSDFDPKALSKGQKVELEHTSDKDFAREIAMDHLTEDPKYYDKLETMEKESSSHWANLNLQPGTWDDVSKSQMGDRDRDRLWHIHRLSYDAVGNPVKSLSELLAEYELFWVVDVDGDRFIDAFIAYKRTPAGKKIGLGGSDGTPVTKRILVRQTMTLLKQPGWYAELSHKAAEIAESSGVPKVQDEATVRAVLKKDIEWLGGGKYRRNITGIGSVVKSMFGNPLVHGGSVHNASEDTYMTKDGKPITFKVHERSPRSQDQSPEENRGFIVHLIEAFVDGKEVGYLTISYIPKVYFKMFYPSVWHYATYIQGWTNPKILESWKNKDWPGLLKAVFPYPGFYYATDVSKMSDKDIQKELERGSKSLISDLQKFKQWHVDKPKVDFIRVEDSWKRQGIATALYNYGAKWLAQVHHLPLYASTLQKPEAAAAWDRMETKGYPIKHQKVVPDQSKEIRDRRRLDYREKTATKTLPQKGHRWSFFVQGDEDSWELSTNLQWGFQGWTATASLSSRNGWRNLSVDNATEHNPGFRKALNELVREYPELVDWEVSFDGPYLPISSLVHGVAPTKQVAWGQLTFYHGTSYAAWEQIQRGGLRPRQETGVEPTFGADVNAPSGRVDAVYLTSQLSMARFAAMDASKKTHSDPIILVVRGIKPERVFADEDSRQKDPAVSLHTLGSIAYAATIPPANISVFEEWDGEHRTWRKLGAIERVAAKYKDKKTIKTPKGKEMVVYEYSDRQIANRNREKAEQVEKLRHSIGDLRKQIQKDLKSDDEKTKAVALAIGLMDATFERVGNDQSAEDGHFGVTGWRKKHLTFGDGKVTIRYTGKSGVKHEKVVETPASVKALKEAVKDKGPEDEVVDASAEDVNSYLEKFSITAKDLRGYHANDEMTKNLKNIRSNGGKLPEDKKEREEKLKAEFKKALKETAEAVGHTESILRSSYLVPTLEESYMKDGTVIEKLTKKGSGNLADELDRRISKLIADYEVVLAKRGLDRPNDWAQLKAIGDPFVDWFNSVFRVAASVTPPGGKPVKMQVQSFLWMATASVYQDGNTKRLREAYQELKPFIPALIAKFSDEGGTEVLTELKTSIALYKNLRGVPTPSFKKMVATLDAIFNSLKGWRRKALDGNFTVALAGPDAFRGTSKGRYNAERDTLFVRATPEVLRRSGGTYASLEYILIHELGHRYERKHPVGINFDSIGAGDWHTTKYSWSEGAFGHSEAFAELFALGHFGITSYGSTQFADKLERFDRVMTTGKTASNINVEAYDYLLPQLPGIKSLEVQLKPDVFKDLESSKGGLDRVATAWSRASNVVTKIGWAKVLSEVSLSLKVPAKPGNFNEGSGVIRINPWVTTTQGATETLIHELGHLVWFRHMTQPQRDGWKTGFKAIKSGLIPGSGFVTEYASKGPEEDFAEVFMLLALGKLTDKLSKDRWKALWGAKS